MDQKQLIVAAMQQEGLTSFYQLAQRLGVPDSRVSQLRHGVKPADEAEIAMLADMAKIDLHVALAAVHKDREKNPAKKAYWQRLLTQFAVAGIAGFLIWGGFSDDAYAQLPSSHFANYAYIYMDPIRIDLSLAFSRPGRRNRLRCFRVSAAIAFIPIMLIPDSRIEVSERIGTLGRCT